MQGAILAAYLKDIFMTKREKEPSGPKGPDEEPKKEGIDMREEETLVLGVLSDLEDDISELKEQFEDPEDPESKVEVNKRREILEKQEALFREYYKKGMTSWQLIEVLEDLADSKRSLKGVSAGAEDLVAMAEALTERIRQAEDDHDELEDDSL